MIIAGSPSMLVLCMKADGLWKTSGSSLSGGGGKGMRMGRYDDLNSYVHLFWLVCALCLEDVMGGLDGT